MALATLGTNANNSLSAQAFYHALVNTAPADLAALAAQIKNDKTGMQNFVPGAYASNGLLYVPRRGTLKILEGDYVAVDSQGWPILVSANSAANGPWTHNP